MSEAIVDPSGEWLYVNETVGQRTSRYPIRADALLGAKEARSAVSKGAACGAPPSRLGRCPRTSG